MKAESGDFNHIVEQVYNLPLEYREELKSLLEHILPMPAVMKYLHSGSRRWRNKRTGN